MEEMLTGVSVPAISTAVYFTVELIKHTAGESEKLKKFIPLLSAALGLLYAFVCLFFIPNIVPTENGVVAAVLGLASGLTATGFHQIIKQAKK